MRGRGSVAAGGRSPAPPGAPRRHRRSGAGALHGCGRRLGALRGGLRDVGSGVRAAGCGARCPRGAERGRPPLQQGGDAEPRGRPVLLDGSGGAVLLTRPASLPALPYPAYFTAPAPNFPGSTIGRGAVLSARKVAAELRKTHLRTSLESGLQNTSPYSLSSKVLLLWFYCTHSTARVPLRAKRLLTARSVTAERQL